MEKEIFAVCFISCLGSRLAGCGGQGIMARVLARPIRNQNRCHGRTACRSRRSRGQGSGKQGIHIKVVEFSDYITPDKALADGDIDLVSYQHKPFLDNFNKQNGTDLVPIGNTTLMRMGIYSDKYKSVDALPDGAVIAIPMTRLTAAAAWRSFSAQGC